MTKEIVKYPDPILRKKCQEVKEITPEIKELALNMAETMVKNQGIGLAASQIGELKRIIVSQTENGPGVFINPEIVKKSKATEIRKEGCLSFPELFLKIKRAKEIEVEFLNLPSSSERGRRKLAFFALQGEKIKIKTEGLSARVFQHEIDHLNGILFIDKISFFQKLWRLLKS